MWVKVQGFKGQKKELHSRYNTHTKTKSRDKIAELLLLTDNTNSSNQIRELSKILNEKFLWKGEYFFMVKLVKIVSAIKRCILKTALI